MRGLDGDWCATSVDCDPTPVSAIGEVLALIDGRRTFELRRLGGRYELDLRTPERISGNPIGTRGIDVLIEHSHDGKGRQYPHGETAIIEYRVTPDAELGEPPY